MNKDELLSRLEESREQFLAAIQGLSYEEMSDLETIGDWSIKDVMAHLLMWEAETIKLLYQARRGQTPTTVHLRNISDDDQNKIWYDQTKERPLERVLADFRTIRDQTILRLDEFTEKGLSDTARFPWLRGKSLTEFIKEYILDHEQDHTSRIMEWRKKPN